MLLPRMRILVRALLITGSSQMTPTPDALRRPRVLGGVAGRSVRALTTAVCALALSVGGVAVVPSSARADDTITTQDYVSFY